MPTFRDARPSDVDALTHIHAALAETHARVDARRWRIPSRAMLLAQMRTSNVVVGEVDSEIVTTFRLDLGRTFFGVATFTPAPSPVYLLDFAVHPAHHRRGFGRQTLVETERRARAHGSGAVRLDANHDPVGACDFYLACGYRIVLRYAETFYLERLLG